MKHLRLCLIEMRRLLRKKSFWLIVILCCCAPALGVLPMSMSNEILSNKYIANPVLAGAAAGGVLWALLSVLEANRIHRSGTDVLTNAVSSPTALPAARMTAQIILSTGTALLCMLLWLPYTAYKMEFLFSFPFYALNYAIMLLPSWWISMLLAESLYQFTRRVEAAALIYVLLAACCLMPDVMMSHSLRWICPTVITYSDAFPTYWELRVAFYSRLILLLLVFGLYLLSLAAVRKYQRGFISSFVRGCKKVILPAGAALLTAFAVTLGTLQPFVDHGPREWQERPHSYKEPLLAAVKCKYNIVPHMLAGTVSGSAEYEIMRPTKQRITDFEQTFQLNCGYTVDLVTMNDTPLPFETLHDDNFGYRTTKFTLPEECEGTLTISFHGMPTQTNANMPYSIMNSVDPEYLSLYNHAVMPWLPDIDVKPYGSDFNMTMPEGITPFLDYHRFTEQSPAENGMVTWHTRVNDTPFSLIAGRYTTELVEAGGTQINFTYGDIYRDTVQEHDICGAVKTVVDYCTEHYGKLNYAEENENLSMMQSSALVLGGWASAGWSTWMEYLLTPEALVDESKGASAKEVFMHELIHQWWGAFGIVFTEEQVWSCEGMTVYSTYRLVKELYGEQYAKKYYVDRWKEDVQLQDRNFYNRHPEYLDMLPESMRITLKESNKNINWYSRMPLMLLKAEKLLGGEEKMDALLQRIYTKQSERQMEHTGTNPLQYSFAEFLQDSGLTEEDLHVDENFTL